MILKCKVTTFFAYYQKLSYIFTILKIHLFTLLNTQAPAKDTAKNSRVVPTVVPTLPNCTSFNACMWTR